MKLFFLLSLLVTSVTASAQALKTKCPTIDSHYILIHGLGGDKGTFGEMEKLIPQHIKCSKAHSFEYATKDGKYSVQDFSLHLNQFIATLPQDNSKINFIMHSQGGLVGLTWIINSINNKPGFSKENLNRLERYMSFSTPFWGSDFALMGKGVFYSFGLEKNSLAPFGKRQLVDMQYGSAFYQNLNKELTTNSELRDYLNNELKVMNAAGINPQTQSLVEKLGIDNSQFLEGDVIVNTPSMKLSFLSQDIEVQKDGETTKVTNQNQSLFGIQTYVEGTHVDFVKKVGAHGVVDTPLYCQNLELCDHDGYLTMLNFVKSGEVSKEDQPKLNGFEAHIVIDLTEYYLSEDELEDIELDITGYDDDNISLSLYRFEYRDVEPISVIDNKLYFIIKGSIEGEELDGELRVKLDSEIAELPEISISIQKDRLSYTNVSLEK